MREYPEEQDSIWILTAGPAIWALHFLTSYITAALYCGANGRSASLSTVRTAIAVYTAIALVGIAGAGWRGFRHHHVRTESTPHDADHPEDRHQFLGFASLLLAGLSAVATLYAGMTILYFETCQ